MSDIDWGKLLDKAEKKRAERLDEFTESLSEAFGVKPHIHPPSLERCKCTNNTRFRISVPPERTSE